MRGKNPTWYALVRWVIKNLYFGTHGGFRSVNQENLPLTGGVLVAPNHLSHMDPPAVACGTKRQLIFMAKEELFHVKAFGALISSIGAYPVKRGESDTESIRKTISLLEEGAAVLIFPEGTRGDGETMLDLNRGVAMLAKRTNAPVVPVGIVGTNVVMPKGKKSGGKAEVIVAYGKPFRYSDVATASTEKENRELFTQALQQSILTLCAENGLALKTGQKHSG